MITYRSSDVKFSWDSSHLPPGQVGPKTCGYVKEGSELEEDDQDSENSWVTDSHRQKRQVDQYEYTPTKTRCPLLLVADYRFFQEMGGSNTKTTINYLVSILFYCILLFNIYKIKIEMLYFDINTSNIPDKFDRQSSQNLQ